MKQLEILSDDIIEQNDCIERHQGVCSYNLETFSFEYDIHIFKGKTMKSSYTVYLGELETPRMQDLQKACDYLLRYRDYVNSVKEYDAIWIPFFYANKDKIIYHLRNILKDCDSSCSISQRLLDDFKASRLSVIAHLEHGICSGCQSQCKLTESLLNENEHLPWWYELGLDQIEKQLPKIERFNLYVE